MTVFGPPERRESTPMFVLGDRGVHDGKRSRANA
jgi:hypothetical protein